MKLIGIPILDGFKTKYADARKALDAWRNEVTAAKWQTTQDIANRFPSASFLSNNRVVFNIKGNNYRLVVQVVYQNELVRIERVGTHAEYDKWSLE